MLPPPQIFPIDDIYGKVTGGVEALYQVFLLPMLLWAWYWVIFPAAFFKNAWVYASPDKMNYCSYIHLVLISGLVFLLTTIVVVAPFLYIELTLE
jgi:hypothetical protein